MFPLLSTYCAMAQNLLFCSTAELILQAYELPKPLSPEEELERKRLELRNGLTGMQRLFLFEKLGGLNDKDEALVAGYSGSVAVPEIRLLERTFRERWHQGRLDSNGLTVFCQCRAAFVPTVIGGSDGTRTRDLLRDRQAF